MCVNLANAAETKAHKFSHFHAKVQENLQLDLDIALKSPAGVQPELILCAG
jgi:hypothetical protein